MKRKSTTIFDLNFISFQHIQSNLRHVDKLRLLLATKYSAISAKEIVNGEPFDLFKLRIDFSAEEIKQLLTDYGSCIKRLRHTKWLSDETTLSYVQALPSRCTNLREVYFSELEITSNNIYGRILSDSRGTIEKLTLENCIPKMPDSWLMIKNMSALNVINLRCSKRSGPGFVGTENLNDLSLDDLLKTQRNLKKLTIYDSFFSKEHPQICAMNNFREISMPECFEESLLGYLKDLVGNRVPVESLEIKMPVCFPKMRNAMKSQIVDHIIKFDKLRVLSFRNSEFLKDSHLVKISKYCRKIEMLDLYRTSFSDLGIITCLENLNDLRHLDISYCNVKRNFYSRLVEIRQQVDFTQKLIIYTRPQMELTAMLQSDEYADTMAFVQLTLSSMRLAKDRSILERLEKLNEKPSLLVLDDNCLHLIMQFLPLVDQLRLSLTNSRFENIMKHILRVHLFKTADFTANCAVPEARILFPRYGKMVTKILITKRIDTAYYDLLSKYLRNVVELHSNDSISCRSVVSNSRNTLEAIFINFCEIASEVTFEISRAAKLRTLNLKGSTLTGVNLGNLTNLTILNLSYVKNLEPKSFVVICKSNRLKELNIIGCETLNDESFQVLVETQTNLKFIRIGGNYAGSNMHLVGGLKNLKYLTMCNLSQEGELKLTGTLAELKYDQLQYLYIDHTDPRNAIEILAIIDNISKLRNLVYLGIPHLNDININLIRTIANACSFLKALDVYTSNNLTTEAVLEAIRLLKNLRHFDVHDCGSSSLNLIYHEAMKITMNECGRRPLVLHGDTSHESIRYLMETRDYISNMKYLKLSSKFLSNLDIYKLVEELTS